MMSQSQFWQFDIEEYYSESVLPFVDAVPPQLSRLVLVLFQPFAALVPTFSRHFAAIKLKTS